MAGLQVTRDLNSINLESFPRTTGQPRTVPPPEASIPPPAVSNPPPRAARAGPILFTLGLGLLSLYFLLSSVAYYEVTTSPSSNSFQWVLLSLGLGYVFVAAGVLLAATGWLLDKRETVRVQEVSTQSERTMSRRAGQVLVLLGASAIAAGFLFLGVIELDAYYNVTFSLPTWTLSLDYAVEGVGVLAVAAGWWIHRRSLTVG